MHNDFGCSRLVFRTLVLPPRHPGPACSPTSLLPDSGGSAWLGDRHQMVGLGRVLAIESMTPGTIADVRHTWEAAPASSCVEGTPSPVPFASFVFRSPARLVTFVPALTLIDETGARWAITAGTGDAPDPLAAVDGTLAEARPALCVPEFLAFSHRSVSRGQWRSSVWAVTQRLRDGATDKAAVVRDMTMRCPHGFDKYFLLERLGDLYPSTWRFCVDSLVGAPPEMLTAASYGTASPRVLAGTCKPGEGETLASNVKDLREYDLASGSVPSTLMQLCSSVTTWGSLLLSLPNVVRLATDVHAHLDKAHLLDLVTTLHPAAAVCGTPRPTAMRLIEELENTKCSRYSRPVDWVDTADDGEFAISLRCGLTLGTRLRLFINTGIMPDSNSDAELTETEAKVRPLLGALRV